jgi:hypothetical protein
MLAALITCPVEVVKTKLQACAPPPLAPQSSRSNDDPNQHGRVNSRMQNRAVEACGTARGVKFDVRHAPRVCHRGLSWVFQRGTRAAIVVLFMLASHHCN